jgi:hypothetical protein
MYSWKNVMAQVISYTVTVKMTPRCIVVLSKSEVELGSGGKRSAWHVHIYSSFTYFSATTRQLQSISGF